MISKGKMILPPAGHVYTRRIVASIVLLQATFLLWAVSQAAPSSGEEDFLIPGNAFAGMSPSPGAWCRYLVVESYGTKRDSSELYLAIPRDPDPPPKGSFWLEIEGIERSGDTLAARILFSDAVISGAPVDSAGAGLLKIFIKHGNGPVESGDEELAGRIEDELRRGRRDVWVEGGKVLVRAAGRGFESVKRTRLVAYEKKIPAGRSTLVKSVDDVHEIYLAEEVPLFHIVRYVSRRSRESRIDPPIPGVPAAGSRKSETELLLIDFGSGAESLFKGWEDER